MRRHHGNRLAVEEPRRVNWLEEIDAVNDRGIGTLYFHARETPV